MIAPVALPGQSGRSPGCPGPRVRTGATRMGAPSLGSVLVVCTGNVCRSPYLERLLRRDLPPQVRVSSAGVRALVGRGMDERIARTLTQRRAEPAGFVARRLTAAMVHEADLVVTVSPRHRREVLELAPEALRRTWTLTELSRACRQGPVDLDVPAESWLAGTASPRSEVARLGQALAARRGPSTTAAADEEAVPDPWNRGDDVLAAMVAHVDRALPPVTARLAELTRPGVARG